MTMKIYSGTNQFDGFQLFPKEEYTSKTKRGECKNDDCLNQRRYCSAYCQDCSDRNKNDN